MQKYLFKIKQEFSSANTIQCEMGNYVIP